MKQKAVEIQNSIREILLRDWDPIGISNIEQASDEYDGYIGSVYQILSRSRSADELIEFLYKTQTETMGCWGVGRERIEVAVTKLLSLEL